MSSLGHLCAPLLESNDYADHFKIDFTQPIHSFRTIPHTTAFDSGFDLSLKSNATWSQIFEVFTQTSCVSSFDTTSHTTKFLDMVGTPSQFAAHLRITLLLSTATHKFFHANNPSGLSLKTHQGFKKTWFNVFFCVLAHFNIICKYYNIAESGSFNLSALLHHFVTHYPDSHLTKSSTYCSIFASKSKIELSHFNNEEQKFLSTILPTAFRVSPMHSTTRDSVIFPSIPLDQADTFTQHYTQLLDTPTSSIDNDNISPGKVSISRIPFSVFAYLGLLNTIMVDMWYNPTWLISLEGSTHISENGCELKKLLLSSSSLPDDLWNQVLMFFSNAACDNICLMAEMCEEMNLIEIMNAKLHSIIRFPICIKDPLSSFATYSAQSTFLAMLQTMSSILTHLNFTFSRFYSNLALHQQCTYFTLQIMYIYFIMQWFSGSEDWLISFFTKFTFQDCLQLFENRFSFKRNKSTITNQFVSLSPLIFRLVASLIARFDLHPQPFLASISTLLLNNSSLMSDLYSHSPFSRLVSNPSPSWFPPRLSMNEDSLLVSRLVSTSFLQFLNLNQSLRYYTQQIHKKRSDWAFCDVICTKIPPPNLSSGIIEGSLQTSLLQIYKPSQQLNRRNLSDDELQDLLGDQQTKRFFHQQHLNDQLSQTLTSISTQILTANVHSITPVDDILIGLKLCQEQLAQERAISSVDLLFHPSTLLIVSPIIHVIPYMAVHHNFNKTMYHSIVCFPWKKTGCTNFESFAWILAYLELYHTFLCKPITISTVQEILLTSGHLFSIDEAPSSQDIEDFSEDVSQFRGKNIVIDAFQSSQYQQIFCMANLSQHSPFLSSLHKHSHIPLNLVLPLYYSYTEALLSVIMGFSYAQFYLNKDNNPIESFCDPNSHQVSNQINIQNDQRIGTNYGRFSSSLSFGTIFQISKKCLFQCEKNLVKDENTYEEENEFWDEIWDTVKNDDVDDDVVDDDDDDDDEHIVSLDAYSEHILSLYNNPHQLTQAYVSTNCQTNSLAVDRSNRPPKRIFGDKTPQKIPLDNKPEQIPLTSEWSSSMVQHSIELFIDLLLNTRSYEFISQIDFSDGKPLAKQSEATFNYYDDHISAALSEATPQHEHSHSTADSLSASPSFRVTQLESSRPMGNLPYFYNLTKQQQVALYDTYSYDALFSANYGPFDDVPLVFAPPEDVSDFSESDLSRLLTDVNTTIPNWLEILLIFRSGCKLPSQLFQEPYI